jgi:hypothetical protein
MAAKAHEISLEAGSKMAAAMKDVINAAAGLSGFVIESARDLVQYMVRRGQMTQEEADKLIREVEAAMPKRRAPAIAHAPAKTAPHIAKGTATLHRPATSRAPARAASRPAAKKAAAKPKAPAKKAASKKPAPKKAAAKKPPPKKKKPVAKKSASKKAKRR